MIFALKEAGYIRTKGGSGRPKVGGARRADWQNFEDEDEDDHLPPTGKKQ